MSNPRPNILWLFLEDMNPWMSCYGDHTIQTPNIDALAASGVKFDRAYQNLGRMLAFSLGYNYGNVSNDYWLAQPQQFIPPFTRRDKDNTRVFSRRRILHI